MNMGKGERGRLGVYEQDEMLIIANIYAKSEMKYSWLLSSAWSLHKNKSNVNGWEGG